MYYVHIYTFICTYKGELWNVSFLQDVAWRFILAAFSWYGAIFVVGYGDVLVFLIKSGNAPSWVCIIEPPKDLMQIFIDGCKAPGIEVLQLYLLAWNSNLACIKLWNDSHGTVICCKSKSSSFTCLIHPEICTKMKCCLVHKVQN